MVSLFYSGGLSIKKTVQDLILKCNFNRYGNIGCGVSRLGIQNPIDFNLKLKCSKGFLDIHILK